MLWSAGGGTSADWRRRPANSSEAAPSTATSPPALSCSRHAVDERSFRFAGYAPFRLYRPVRTTQAALHLQDAPRRPGPEGQVRVG